jgi:hypothetical protein
VSKLTSPIEGPPRDPAELRRLIDRAHAGDESTRPALRKLLDDPAFVDRLGGDLARQAEWSLVDAVAGKDVAFKEALTRKLELLRAELLGPDPTSLERLLVERVVACWLQVYEVDIRTAQAKDLPLKWADFYQKRMDRAHRRFLSAIKTLAAVRRLALPVLQVNIAKKQINVAGVAPSDGRQEP